MGLPNLALNKPTDQSSTLVWKFFTPLASDLAVDGNHNTSTTVGSCAHTQVISLPSLDWWLVDLQQIFLILLVSITNRGDCCSNRLANFTVEVHTSDPMTNGNTGQQLCYWHKGEVGSGLTVDLPCAVNTIGRYVRIVKYSNKPLTLCEVEVRGTLLHKTCGESSVVFGRLSTGAREPDFIISSHEDIQKLNCASMCLRKASCKGFNFRSPSMGVVSCELLATALDPIKNVSWNVYTISRFQCPLQ